MREHIRCGWCATFKRRGGGVVYGKRWFCSIPCGEKHANIAEIISGGGGGVLQPRGFRIRQRPKVQYPTREPIVIVRRPERGET